MQSRIEKYKYNILRHLSECPILPLQANLVEAFVQNNSKWLAIMKKAIESLEKIGDIKRSIDGEFYITQIGLERYKHLWLDRHFKGLHSWNKTNKCIRCGLNRKGTYYWDDGKENEIGTFRRKCKWKIFEN